jgi:tricorn protease
MLDPGTKRAKQVTFSTDVPVRYPSSDGHRVVFQLGPVLGIYDPATGKSSKLAIQLHSDRLHVRPYQAAVGQAEGAGLGPTGNRIVLATHGQLVTVPAKEGAMRELVTDSSQRVQFPAWSPDGKQIAYISDASGEEQIFLLGVGGDAVPKQLTRDLKGEHGPIVWSPDNKHLLVGDRAGDIQLVDAGSGAVTLVAHSQGTLEYDQIQTDFVFSPDSKWVAFSTSLGTDNSVAELYEISSGKVTQLSDPTINSQSPSFSMDGKFLYMLQDRSISMTEQGISHRISHDYESQVTAFTLASDTQSPYLPKEEDEAEVAKKPEEAAAKAAQTEAKKDIKIDIEGIADRYLDMKVPPGHYSAVLALPGKLLLQSPVGILSFDITTKTLAMVGPLLQIADATPDRKKLLVASPIGLQVIDAGGGPIPPGTGAVKLAGLTVTIDPAAQWRQMFFESWRVARDFFYDPKMLGIDWNAVKRKYEAELPMVGSRDDLSRIIADMISELNTGHAYVSGPTAYPAHAGRPGLLGIDLVRDTAAGAYKIKHILKGDTWNPEPRSPFAEPGVDVHEGDYLLKIRGTNLKENQDPAALLTGTAGQVISVTVNSKPTLVGARTVLVTPIASETELRLEDWVKSRREYVTKASGGQIGYVYMSDMEATGANQFAREYYPIVDKPGIIVDVRGNGGGFISGNILNDLDSKISGYFAFRAGGVYRREGWAPLGHVAALTNEFAFSDGEYFSEFFKRLKIGPLIGHRTGGGEVGSGGGYRLVDGGTVYIPNYGAFVPGEWVIEGRGAVPDIEVDQDPAAVMAGKDPQLDKAISVMLDEIKKEPVKLPVHPPYPVKLKGSRGG